MVPQATSWDIVRQHVYFRPKEGNTWESKPEFPTFDEILAKEEDLPKLPENPINEPWPSKSQYLTAQYEILRREATEGLRASVRSYVDHRRREPMMDTDDTNIYTKVYIREYLMTAIGPLVRISFSVERARYKIQWLLSKRLQPGKLVALSPKSDNFKTICKLAIVMQRPYKGALDQDPPTVDLMWADPVDSVIDPDLEMVMIESMRGYFESARHAMIGLQHAARTDSPLDKYLTGQHNTDDHPEFLKQSPLMDLSGLVSEISPGTEGLEDKLRAFDIVNDSLPNLEGQSPTDESQLRGLHRIVSKELAIVQGPPGTGKTFTSVEAIKVMVRNRRRRRDPPIIVAAQTNHALDQLLVHCLHADIKILRLGGRTKSEEVKPHTIYEQRQNCGALPSDSKMRPIRIQMKEIIAKVVELRDSVFGDSLLNPDLLLEHGIITGAQHQSLIDDSMESAQEIEELGPFALWLGNSRIPATLRVDRHVTQPERSEAEARRNLPEFEWDDDEAIEDMDVEDENELFRATHIEFKHTWTGKDPAGYTSWDRIVQRALRNDDLFRIPENLRGAVYQYFQSKMLEVVRPRFIELLTKYVKLCKERQANRFHANVELVKLQCYDIIGCTTTGLSKYRGCLAAMQPVSLLIEEAAETREANIVSALYPTLQQLILVGDHKQLAPKCDIIHLGDPPYNLNISLFERMVNLGNQYVMLNKQRRMKPELREIVMPFYEGLEDHPSVTDPENRPDVPGMGGRNCWLFHHTWPEDMNSEFSKFNEMEAEMIANFFAYLVANGTESQRITVLTFYKGQRKVLLNKLNRHPSIPGLQFNVCTVDSFQGEENDVILLSMVRSPQLDRPFAVGFLEDPRRATVAISRARRGFYVFGNVENVLSAHEASKELWRKICEGFANQGMFGSIAGMPIVCQNHGKETWIREIGDWDGNAGGCDQPCGRWRHCGHPCQINCHPMPHEMLPCDQPCRSALPCGHGCQRNCGQLCSCDCEAFRQQGQATQPQTNHALTLVERMMGMGLDADESLVASMSQGKTSEQTLGPTSQRGQSKQGGAHHNINGGSAKSRKENGTKLTTGGAAKWRETVRMNDFLEAQIARPAIRSSPTVIEDIYRPTTILDNGCRVNGGNRIVQKITIHASSYSQVAAAGHAAATQPADPPQTAAKFIGEVDLLSFELAPSTATPTMAQGPFKPRLLDDEAPGSSGLPTPLVPSPLGSVSVGANPELHFAQEQEQQRRHYETEDEGDEDLLIQL